jgi:methylenetetrahydrofolate dehydrogenase (NADP+)/methenyltetrahydrofolate cyclohydrolase
MMMNILDGKKSAQYFKDKIAEEVSAFTSKGHRKPHLAAILVGNDGASETYVASKVKSCEQIGFESTLIRFDVDVTEEVLLAEVRQLNAREDVDGVLVQLPLPKHINEEKVTLEILAEKDVDGFHPESIGRMMLGLPGYIPATPKGIMMLLEHYNIDTQGKHAVIIGRSSIVGTPMSILLSRNSQPGNCTVTLTHSRTADLSYHTLQADIIVAALGKPLFLKAEMVKEGAIVIDVGITRMKDDSAAKGYRICGDVDFETVAPKCSWITPVPGGVGAMTIAALMQNTLEAYKRRLNS